MLGGGGSGAGRVRLLHEAVDRLTAALQQASAAWARNPAPLPKDLKPSMDRLALAMEDGVAQLRQTNASLARLARTPLLGALGGGAQAEVDRLAAATERVTATIEQIRARFP